LSFPEKGFQRKEGSANRESNIGTRRSGKKHSHRVQMPVVDGTTERSIVEPEHFQTGTGVVSAVGRRYCWRGTLLLMQDFNY
jgi:hypothetical protein